MKPASSSVAIPARSSVAIPARSSVAIERERERPARTPSKTRSATMRALWDDPLNYALWTAAMRARKGRAIKTVYGVAHNGTKRQNYNAYQREYMRMWRAKTEGI